MLFLCNDGGFMRKKFKIAVNKIAKFLMLFAMIFSSLEEPLMVFAETGDYEPTVGALKLGTDGEISQTGSVSTTATSKDGKVDVTKTVTADKTTPGKYHVEFNIKGKSTQEKDPIYVVIVFDRSGSMCGREGYSACTNQTKWDNAVAGAKSFASNVINSISTAKVALVTFAGSATQDRGFSREALTDSNFGNPFGGTNLNDGLIKANSYLNTIPQADQARAKKFVVVMSDGKPTYYVNSYGSNTGNGEDTTKNVLDATLGYADTLKQSASIYSIGYSLPSGNVYNHSYTYGGRTYSSLTAKQVLSFIASPKADGSGNNYYNADDEDDIIGVFDQIATSIIAAGGNATLTDNIGGSFKVVGSNNYGGTKKSETIASITDAGYKFEFDIEINPDVETGWHNTNSGFKLEYTNSAGGETSVIGTEDPMVYWKQAVYNYKVNYYKDSTNGTKLATDERSAAKNTIINESNVEKDKYLAQAGDGYEFKNTSPTSITIDGSGNQEINVVYGLKEFKYNVNYYYDNVKDSSLSYGPVIYGTTVDSKDYYLNNTDIKDGYKLDEENTSSDIVTIDDNGKEINIYYIKDSFGYTINYYFNGSINKNLTKVGKGEFGTNINARDNYLSSDVLSDNGYNDYFLDPTKPHNPDNIIISDDENSNHIDVYYVNTEINQEIEKTTSTQIINSENDVVNYKVEYETTATNVKEGDKVVVTITDTLPYEINLEKSDLDGGRYSNKTITWTFTETVSEFTPNYKFTKEINYSVVYKDFASVSSSDKKLVNEVSGKVTVGDKTIEKTTDTAEVPVEIYGELVVTYKDEDGNELAVTETSRKLAGTNYTTSSKTFAGYSLNGMPTNKDGKYVGEDTVYVDYVYKKNAYAYTIDYHFNGTLDSDLRNSGSALYEAVISARDNYLSSDVLSDNGYNDYFLDPTKPHNPDNIIISDDENSNHIDVYYVNTEINQEIEKTTSTQIINSENDVVNYKVEYETTATNVKEGDKVVVTITDTLPYEINLEKSDLDGGRYSNKTITWTFTETVSEFTPNYKFTKEINYSVVYKDFASVSSSDKKLVNEVSGKVTVGDKTIEKTTDTAEVPVEIYGELVVTYKDEDGNELAVTETSRKLAGTNYTTSSKEFFGYELKETPTNKDGKYVGDKVIYVEYVYGKSIGYSEEELVKTGDNEVLSVDSPFNYTISYKTSIYDYVGDVEITIEDDPEFEIDEEKSIIPDACIYSSSKIVCKYTRTISSVNDQDISIEEKLTLYYKDINKAEVSNNAVAIVKYGSETKETDTSETIIVPSGKVVSKYIKENGEKLCDDVVSTGLVGANYKTNSKIFDGYSLIDTYGSEDGKYTIEDITVTYVYSEIPLPPKTGFEGSSFNYLYFMISLVLLYVIKKNIQ